MPKNDLYINLVKLKYNNLYKRYCSFFNMEMKIEEALKIAIDKHISGDLREAELMYRAILDVVEHPDAYHLLGLIASQTNHNDDAVSLIKKAIAIKEEPLFYHNLAMVFDKLENKESIRYFEKAVDLGDNYPNSHLAYFNLGVYYKDRGDLDRALRFYDSALKIKPDFSPAHLNRGLILLLLGRFTDGWGEYEYRDKEKLDKPEWNGESGKKVLVLAEQGFGDSLMFARYLPLIRDRNCKVIFDCKPELKSLLRNPEFDYYNKQDYDCYVNLLSLPRIFDTNLSNIPKIIELRIEKKKFSNKKFKVGVCWHGNKNQENDKNRSVTSDKFNILKEISGVEIYSLQKGEDGGFILLDDINSFEGTSSLIKSLDLVISVDTSIAHLAGSLGVKCWTLLCYTPDWRYLLERKDSPWYPSMELFRQPSPGDWDSVFFDVKQKLEKIILSNNTH